MRDFYNHQKENLELIPDPALLLGRSRAELEKALLLFGFTTYGWMRSVLAGIVLSAAFSLSFQDLGNLSLQQLFTALLIGTVAGPVAYVYLFSLMRVNCLKKLRKIDLQLVNNEMEVSQPASEVLAEQVYKTALAVSIAGFIIVIAGILMILYKETEQAYLVISIGMGAECLSAVCFSFYTKMISRVAVYQHKPYQVEFD